MFSRSGLRAIGLFSELADKELDYLAKTSADIRALPGEYVVYEGESRRSVFVLVEGRLEVTKFIDGTERVIGVRESGQLFGEVPVVLDSPFLVSFRATQNSRVMRIDSKEFHVVATASPKFFKAVVSAALDRVEGLQELAAESAQPTVTLIAPQWDNAGHEVREFLERNSVQFDWFTPEDPEVPSLARESIKAQKYPVALLRDGTVLADPSARDIANAIGLCVSPKGTTFDVAIIGGGPAGLAAAVYGASEGLSTVLLEREAPGGQAGTSSRIENYLGFPFGISGAELATRALQQARRLGADIAVTRTVQSLDVPTRTLYLDGGDALRAKTMILAIGVSWRRLDIRSLDRLRGRGVYYGAAPGEASSVQGKNIYLVGGGNSAGQAALNFSNFADCVTLLVRGDALSKSMSYYLIEQLKTKANVHVETCCQVVDAYGGDHLEAISVANSTTTETTRRNADALLILIGADAETGWLPPEIYRDSQGYVVTGPDTLRSGHWSGERDPYLLETTVPGLFAVGDVRAGSTKRVAASVGEGSMAIAFVHQHLAQAARLPQPMSTSSAS
jgi:thioredoxin reductase (NADPH)